MMTNRRPQHPRFRSILAMLLVGITSSWLTVPSVTAQESEAAAEESSPPAFESPEAVYAVAQAAFNRGDWRGFFECVSPDRRNELVGELAVTFASMSQIPDVDARVGQLVEAYLPKDFNPMDVMGSDDPRAEVVRLAQRMADPESFFADAMTLANDMRFDDADNAAQITGLSEIIYAEDKQTAQADVTITTPDTEESEPWSFKLFEGVWYLSMQ